MHARRPRTPTLDAWSSNTVPMCAWPGSPPVHLAQPSSWDGLAFFTSNLPSWAGPVQRTGGQSRCPRRTRPPPRRPPPHGLHMTQVVAPSWALLFRPRPVWRARTHSHTIRHVMHAESQAMHNPAYDRTARAQTAQKPWVLPPPSAQPLGVDPSVTPACARPMQGTCRPMASRRVDSSGRRRRRRRRRGTRYGPPDDFPFPRSITSRRLMAICTIHQVQVHAGGFRLVHRRRLA